MTTIKYNAGETVYWLSSDGFVKGIIKSVLFDQTTNSTRLVYRLIHPKQSKEYCGDAVHQDLIFKSYDDMFEFYKVESNLINETT